MARRFVVRAFALPFVVMAAAPTTTTTEPPAGSSGAVALGPQTPATVEAAAVRVATLRDQLTALQARQVQLQSDLATATAATAARRAQVDEAARIATDTLTKARQQAVAAYVFGDPSTNQEAVVRSLFAVSPGDAVWGVTMVHIVTQERDELARDAASRRTQADADLLAAQATQDAAAADLAAVGPQIDDTGAQLQQAQLDLIAIVIRLGQSTIEGLTTVAYDAYTRTARALHEEQPECGLRWELLAAIGRTESNHGAGRIDANGDTAPPILGPPIGPDSDGGELDTDPTLDHAVGPMQFIPSTWRKWGADGNADTRQDVNNIFDETLAAGRYLCAAAGDLTLLTREGVARAIWAYNPNEEYLRIVGARFEALANDLAAGWFSGVDLPEPPPASGVDPGGVTGGGDAPPADPPPPPRPVTDVRVVAPFGADGRPLVAAETPGACGPTWLLAPRTNVARCSMQPVDGSAAEVLDPCLVAPADPTLVACLPDPTQPERVLRLAAPAPAESAGQPPPYYGLVLSGGDVCLPWRDETPPPPPEPPPTTTTTTTTVPGAPPPETTAASTSTTTSPPTTATTTTVPPETTTTERPPTTAPVLTVPTTVPAPPPSDVAYRCRSGALVLGEPDTSEATWTALVSQRGLSPRSVDVAAAYV